MNSVSKYGTAINCIDGRVQNPVSDWIKLHSHVQYVDMITEPGPDKVLAEADNQQKINSIADRLRLSIELHQSSIIAVAGHHDCAANKTSIEEHHEQIIMGVDLLVSWRLRIKIIGLYVNEWNSIDLICDSEKEFEPMRSFL